MAIKKRLSSIFELENFANTYLWKVTKFQGDSLFRFGVLSHLLGWRVKNTPPPGANRVKGSLQLEEESICLMATFHLTISMRGQRAMRKIQRNNYHHGSCRPSLTSKTSSVSLIFTHGTNQNVKNG